MLCKTCGIDFTNSEYEDHLFDIKSKIICSKCHSNNIKVTIHNNIMHSQCVKCGAKLI